MTPFLLTLLFIKCLERFIITTVVKSEVNQSELEAHVAGAVNAGKNRVIQITTT